MDTRRSFFIKSAGAASVLYKIAGTAPDLKAAGPNDQIGVGFIGVGIRGSYHVENFSKAAGARAIMAADVYDGHLDWVKEATGGKVETTRDYHKLLSRRDIDAVVIATPDHWHARMALDALAAGKHVYVEKPMTWSFEEGEQIIAAVNRSGRLLMVGSQGKTSPLVAKARELVKSGILGKLNLVRMADNRNDPEGAWVYPIPADAVPGRIDWTRWLGSAPKRDFDPKRVFRWRCWWEYSGGVATDLWVHSFTYLHEMMGVTAPTSATAQGGIFRFNDGRTCPDLMTGLYEYPGFLLEITANLGNSRRTPPVLVMGSEATLSLTPKGVQVDFEPNPSPVASYGLNGWTKEAKEKYLESMGFGGGKNPVVAQTKAPQEITVAPALEHWEYFIESLREGKPSRETAEEGHYAAGAAHMGNMAFLKGRRMRWDLGANKIREA
jgi:predicted dehydrogenase